MIKLEKIKFYNNKIFKNQEFDFTINNNSVKNIIFAGENGTGKTKLLEELYNALYILKFYNLNLYMYNLQLTTTYKALKSILRHFYIKPNKLYV